jgi:hypothetical protein
MRAAMLKKCSGNVFIVSLFIVLTSLSFGVAYGSNNAWTSLGPDGGDVAALAIDPITPTTIYAGTWYGGIFPGMVQEPGLSR